MIGNEQAAPRPLGSRIAEFESWLRAHPDAEITDPAGRVWTWNADLAGAVTWGLRDQRGWLQDGREHFAVHATPYWEGMDDLSIQAEDEWTGGDFNITFSLPAPRTWEEYLWLVGKAIEIALHVREAAR